jgi:hypothetical protein
MFPNSATSIVKARATFTSGIISLLLFLSLAFAGCTSNMPEGIEARNDSGFTSLFSYPDTVEVHVFGEASRRDVEWGHPSAVERAWLDKHDYIHVRTEFDSLGTEVIRDAEKEADASLTEGETIAGNRIYVRVP